MTHLTQITLNFPLVARLGLNDTYDWHQCVWQCFPGRSFEGRDFLTRLDPFQDGVRLLIVSAVQPTRPCWCLSEFWKTKQIPESYFDSRRYAFQLCANPTKKILKLGIDAQPTKNGKRVPLRTREEYLAWIGRKGERGGFSVEESSLCTFQRGREYFKKKGVLGLHSAVEFQGVLEVVDSGRFRETFEHGIGSAKAFGFGLLVISPMAAIN